MIVWIAVGVIVAASIGASLLSSAVTEYTFKGIGSPFRAVTKQPDNDFDRYKRSK